MSLIGTTFWAYCLSSTYCLPSSSKGWRVEVQDRSIRDVVLVAQTTNNKQQSKTEATTRVSNNVLSARRRKTRWKSIGWSKKARWTNRHQHHQPNRKRTNRIRHQDSRIHPVRFQRWNEVNIRKYGLLNRGNHGIIFLTPWICWYVHAVLFSVVNKVLSTSMMDDSHTLISSCWHFERIPSVYCNKQSEGSASASSSGSKTIVLKAMGRAINKAVTIAEILKRKMPLHQWNVLSSLEMIDLYEPIEEGLDVVENRRYVSCLTITLSLTLLQHSEGMAKTDDDSPPLDTHHFGYQPIYHSRNDTSSNATCRFVQSVRTK